MEKFLILLVLFLFVALLFVLNYKNVSTNDNVLVDQITIEKSWIPTRKTTEKSRTVDWKTYTASHLFATTEDFKTNYVEPTDEFKKWLKIIWADPDKIKFVEWQAIIDDVKKNWNKQEIIRKIVEEKYDNSLFEFIKNSWLIKLSWDKIDKSELTSCRGSDGSWEPDGLCDYGYIWLRGLGGGGSLICVRFREDWASWCWESPKTAMRVASQK